MLLSDSHRVGLCSSLLHNCRVSIARSTDAAQPHRSAMRPICGLSKRTECQRPRRWHPSREVPTVVHGVPAVGSAGPVGTPTGSWSLIHVYRDPLLITVPMWNA